MYVCTENYVAWPPPLPTVLYFVARLWSNAFEFQPHSKLTITTQVKAGLLGVVAHNHEEYSNVYNNRTLPHQHHPSKWRDGENKGAGRYWNVGDAQDWQVICRPPAKGYSLSSSSPIQRSND